MEWCDQGCLSRLPSECCAPAVLVHGMVWGAAQVPLLHWEGYRGAENSFLYGLCCVVQLFADLDLTVLNRDVSVYLGRQWTLINICSIFWQPWWSCRNVIKTHCSSVSYFFYPGPVSTLGRFLCCSKKPVAIILDARGFQLREDT